MPNTKKRFPGGYVIINISLSRGYRNRLSGLAAHYKVNRSEMVRRMIAAIELLIQREDIPADVLRALSSPEKEHPEAEDQDTS